MRSTTLRSLLVALLGATLAPSPAAAAPRHPSWCRAPAWLKLDLAALPRRPRPPKLVPIAAPTTIAQEPDLAACKAKLQSKGFCLFQDLAIITVGTTITEAGRCDDMPPGTRSFAIPSNEAWNTYFNHLLSQPEIEDRYQTYVFFQNFPQVDSAAVPPSQTQVCGTIAWHSELSNGLPIAGLGRPYVPSKTNLHAMINVMWSEKFARAEWETEDETSPGQVLVHETEHDVCCYMKFLDPATTKSSSALIENTGHWSLFHNTYGQLMYGANWREEGNGTFFSVPPALGTRPLDLYLWGLVPPEQVPPVFLVDTTDKQSCAIKPLTLAGLKKDCAEMDLGSGKKCKDDEVACLAKFDPCVDPPYYRDTAGGCVPYSKGTIHSPTNLTAKGVKKLVTLDDMIKVVGKRVPDWKESYKTNTQLFILLVGGGYELEQETVDRLAKFRRHFSRLMYKTTDHKLRNLNSLDGVDDSGLWEWNGHPDWKDATELEGWAGEALKQDLQQKDGELLLQLKDETSAIKHTGVRVEGKHYDAFQVVLTVPPAGGKVQAVIGKLVLKGASETRTLRFPILADGLKHKVTIHPPHALLREATCKGCLPVCKNSGKADEGWYASCPGKPDELLRAGACKSKEGLSLCGPYCTSGKTDLVLEESAPEGWYDSCQSQLASVYTELSFHPVTGPAAAQVSGTVKIDRIDLFRVADLKDLDESKRKDGEKDYDGDGIVNAFDNCPTLANADQKDSNLDEKGDACGDFDSDGVMDAVDNCPTTVNSLQQDDDGDGIGNACDPDFELGGCALAPAGALPLGILLGFLALLLLTVGRAAPRGPYPNSPRQRSGRRR